MSNMTLGSLFDGSGGFPLGGMLAGITPVWASEIEPFPIRVTTKRLPSMKHYGRVLEEAVAVENHPMDGRVKLEENGKVQTLSERMGTGGNNVPLVLEIRSGCEGGGKGPLIQTETEEPYYIVRRLTPTECARLQGFPDWWCSALGTEEPSEEDIAFWRDVFETHRAVTGSASKPKTDAQIMKWLKDPHTDSAEYKLWGNGVALPCVYFVLSGIVYFHRMEQEVW